jgi:hypothetical protein
MLILIEGCVQRAALLVTRESAIKKLVIDELTIVGW